MLGTVDTIRKGDADGSLRGDLFVVGSGREQPDTIPSVAVQSINKNRNRKETRLFFIRKRLQKRLFSGILDERAGAYLGGTYLLEDCTLSTAGRQGL